MNYYTAETEENAPVNNLDLWTPTKAKTVSSAKRVAQGRRMFQRTAAHVAILNADGSYDVVATRYPKGHAMAGWSR
jgi:uncharacterized protein with GYD domain